MAQAAVAPQYVKHHGIAASINVRDSISLPRESMLLWKLKVHHQSPSGPYHEQVQIFTTYFFKIYPNNNLLLIPMSPKWPIPKEAFQQKFSM